MIINIITNVIIIALLVILVFKDKPKDKMTWKLKPEETNEEEERKQQEFRTQFEKLMAYSINDAIEKYKGDE